MIKLHTHLSASAVGSTTQKWFFFSIVVTFISSSFIDNPSSLISCSLIGTVSYFYLYLDRDVVHFYLPTWYFTFFLTCVVNFLKSLWKIMLFYHNSQAVSQQNNALIVCIESIYWSTYISYQMYKMIFFIPYGVLLYIALLVV